MDPALLEYLVGLSAGVTQSLIESLARGMRKKYSAAPRQKAMERCIYAGFGAIAEKGNDPIDIKEYLEQVFVPYFNSQDVLDELGKLLSNHAPDMGVLEDVFKEDFNFERLVSYASFKESMGAFFEGFLRTADREQEFQGEISIGLLREILDALQETSALLHKANALTPTPETKEQRYL